VLESKRKAMIPTPPRPDLAERNRPLLLAGGSTVASFKKDTAQDENIYQIIDDKVDLESSESSSIDWETTQLLARSIKDEDEPVKSRRTPRRLSQRRRTIDSHANTEALPQTNLTEAKLSPSQHKAYASALSWLEKFKKDEPRMRNKIQDSDILIYALWHEGGLSVQQISGLLKFLTSSSLHNCRPNPKRVFLTILHILVFFKLPANKDRTDALKHELGSNPRLGSVEPWWKARLSDVSSGGPQRSEKQDGVTFSKPTVRMGSPGRIESPLST
jgi:hypothetical protein